jgi:EAL domain-containing protein (putative c-di-GMP-specific phosphodiesterase class I)
VAVGESSLLGALGRPGGLVVAFQPMLEWREPGLTTVGLEALVRGARGSGLESASDLFARARREGAEVEVDRLCLRAIFRCVEERRPELDVSVNVHASTLGGDPEFPTFLFRLAEAHAIDLARVTVEIVEQSRTPDEGRLQANLAALRQAGLRIALDDVGLGYSNYQMMLDCVPDFLKVDRYLVAGCDLDLRRRAILDSVFLLGGRIGARMVAEGVETRGELQVLTMLGVELFQGFLFSRPIPSAELERNLSHSSCPPTPAFRP